MPDWRVARSLDKLLAQLNTLAPNRSRASDGSIGDDAHRAQGSASDHNPWFVLASQPLVTARDFTHDPAGGLDCDRLAAALIASRDPRIKYLIWRGRLMDSRAVAGNGYRPWTWQQSSGHHQHLHLSVMATASADDTRPWALPGLTKEDDVTAAEVWTTPVPSHSTPSYAPPARVWLTTNAAKLERLQASVDNIAGALTEQHSELLAAVREGQDETTPTDYERLGKSIAANLPAPTGGVTPQDLERELLELFARIYNLGGVQRSPGSEV
ncbi:hypothetical protein ACVDFE_02045 [Lentzea chajnantorensis]